MTTSDESAEAFVDLPSGLALSPDEANEVARSSMTRLIVPAGPADVGKTTLLAEIYERFLEGPFAGSRFAWSRTLLGFEQRAHKARISSMRESATTPRTPLPETDRFLHLCLAPGDGRSRDILIADWPGEIFRQMRDDVDTARANLFLPRADHIAFLVNGEHFGDLGLRHEAHHEADMLIQSLLDAGLDGAVTSIIYTKWDAAITGDAAESLEDFVTQFQEELLRKHGHRLGELHFVRTAARPVPGSELIRGTGLDEVIRLWIDSARPMPRLPAGPTVELLREFDRFLSERRGGL